MRREVIKGSLTRIKLNMDRLTKKEEEIMNLLWEHGDMQVREMQALYPEPKPHVNTIATFIKILEEKGFVAHKAINQRCYIYFAKVTRDGYKTKSLNGLVEKLFDKSYLGVVSTLVKEEKISIEELQEMINEIKGRK